MIFFIYKSIGVLKLMLYFYMEHSVATLNNHQYDRHHQHDESKEQELWMG